MTPHFLEPKYSQVPHSKHYLTHTSHSPSACWRVDDSDAVKLAAANPLMSLINDVSSFLRLVDAAAGRSLTCLTKDEATVVAAAAAAAARAPAGSTPPQVQLHHDLKSTIATMNSRPPFAVKPVWQVLHVPVHKELTPVYILGNNISEAAITRGISTFMSGSALKILAKSAETLAAGLAAHSRQQQQYEHSGLPDSQDVCSSTAPAYGGTLSSLQHWHRPTESLQWTSSSSSSSDSREADRVAACQTSSRADSTNCCTLPQIYCSSNLSSCASADSSHAAAINTSWQQPVSAADANSQQQQQHSTTSSPSELSQATGRAESLNAARARIRSQLLLDVAQQQKLSEHVREKLTTLRDRCKVFALVRQS